MIVVYPMLCSSGLSHQVLPAVAKTVEKYLIVYRLNEILEEAKKEVSSARVVKGRIKLKEDENIPKEIGDKFISLTEQGEHQPGTKRSGKSSEDIRSEIDKLKNKSQEYDEKIQRLQSKLDDVEGENKEKIQQQIENLKKEKEKTEAQIEKYKEEVEKIKADRQKAKQTAVTGVSMPRNIESLEPTWMEVDMVVSGQQIKELIGVKVIPYRINAEQDVSLMTLLSNDRNLSKIEKSLTSMGRKLKKSLFRMYDEMKRKTIGKLTSSGEPIKGDPRRDVIMARTSYKENVFVCIDASEMDDEFFTNIGSVKSMFDLGWPSIIAVDEIEKMASFCMQGYQGICYNVSFSRMFRTMGDSEGKVYDDMQSVKKSSGGLFRQKSKPKKVFGENLAYGILDDYQTHLKEIKSQKKVQEKEIIDENVKEILTEGKLRDAWNYMNRVASIGKIFKSGNLKSAMSKFKGRGDINKITQQGKQVNPKFDECYKVAKKRIDKFAPNVNKKLRESFAASVATASGTEPDRPVKYAEQLSDGSIKAIGRWYNNLKKKQEIPDEKSDKIIGAIIFSITLIVIISFSGALIYGVIRGAMILAGGPDVTGIEDIPTEPTSGEPLATKSTMKGMPDSKPGGRGGGVADIPARSGASLSMGPAAILINLANNPDSVEAATTASKQLKESGGILGSIKNIWDLLGSIVMLAWDAGATIINIISTIFGSLISLVEHVLTIKGMKSLFNDPSIIFDIFKYRDVIPTFYL